MDAAILFNCCTAHAQPDWAAFDTLEIGGCINEPQPFDDGTCIIGGVPKGDAEFFTVYGHLKEGGFEAITDCDTYDDATNVAAALCELSSLPIVVAC